MGAVAVGVIEENLGARARRTIERRPTPVIQTIVDADIVRTGGAAGKAVLPDILADRVSAAGVGIGVEHAGLGTGNATGNGTAVLTLENDCIGAFCEDAVGVGIAPQIFAGSVTVVAVGIVVKESSLQAGGGISGKPTIGVAIEHHGIDTGIELAGGSIAIVAPDILAGGVDSVGIAVVEIQ